VTLAQIKSELDQIAVELDALQVDDQVVRLKRRLADLIAAIP